MATNKEFPAACPAFQCVFTAQRFEGHPLAFGAIHDQTGKGYAPDEVIPLTRAAALVYTVAGGTDEDLTKAFSHRRGKHSTTVFEEAVHYIERQNARNEGY